MADMKKVYDDLIIINHYHLQVQANSKKIVQKNDAIFSIYGKNGIKPWHFF